MPRITNQQTIEAHAMRIYGCSNSEAIALNDGVGLRVKKSKAMAYYTQKQAAKARNIEWLFDFKEWVQVWNNSGLWDSRGCGKGVCMTRHGDVGPYSTQNVSIKTNSENAKESLSVKPWKDRIFAVHTNKSHCCRGHLLDASNRTKAGACKACDSIRHKKWYEKRKAQAIKDAF